MMVPHISYAIVWHMCGTHTHTHTHTHTNPVQLQAALAISIIMIEVYLQTSDNHSFHTEIMTRRL